jgi:hypothetical protein
VSTASTTCSIGGFTPNPLRADREVQEEGGDNADHVGEQVVHAEPDEHLHDADVDRHRGERQQAEGREALRGQPHPAGPPATVPLGARPSATSASSGVASAERPELVQHVVVQDRYLDRRYRGGQQRHAFDAV